MNTEMYRFKAGNFECMAVSDGIFDYPDHSFFVNAPKERLEQVLREHNIQPGVITAPWTCLAINTGQHRVLVDTGGGAGTVPSAGKLLRNLQAEGIEPVDIDTVILTDGHPDHIGGNTDAEGKLRYRKKNRTKKERNYPTPSSPNLVTFRNGRGQKKQNFVISSRAVISFKPIASFNTSQ